MGQAFAENLLQLLQVYLCGHSYEAASIAVAELKPEFGGSDEDLETNY